LKLDRFAQRAVASRRRTTRITMRNELQWYVDMMSSERAIKQASLLEISRDGRSEISRDKYLEIDSRHALTFNLFVLA